MQTLKALIVASFLVVLASCSMPDVSSTTKMMNAYWKFYKNEQYDSLKQFYMEGRIPEDKLNLLLAEMRDMREKYGDFTRVNNGELGVKKTLGPDEINLSYQVMHEKQPVEYKFIFEHVKGDQYKIVAHSMIIQTMAF